MNRITYEVFLANWTKIIEYRNNHPTEITQSNDLLITKLMTILIITDFVR